MPSQVNPSSTGSYYYPGCYVAKSAVNQASKTISQSSSFLGDAYTTVLNSVDVSNYKCYTVTIINNSVNNLISASLQASPNNVNWGTILQTTLTSSGMFSCSFVDKSYSFFRIQGWPSGSGGANTGSLDCYVTVN